MPPKRHIYIWEQKTLYATTSNFTGWHRHFGASIAVSTAGPFVLETKKESREFQAALVPPNVEHRAQAAQTRMAVLLVDPDSPDFRPLAAGGPQIQEIPLSAFQSCLPDIDQIIDGRAGAAMVHKCAADMVTLLHKKPPAPLDERIEKVLLRLRAAFPDVPSLELLAREQGISANRLMTLFKANLGLPVRRYLLWLRLRTCVRWLEGGANLTDTAHAAGFSDSAHLSRVFRENFGMAPSEIFGPSAGTVVRIMDAVPAQ